MSELIDRTAWMSGRYGVMSHWLFPGVLPERGRPARSLDEAVEAFDLGRTLADFEASGAEWYLFTLGQNTGMYASPNAVIEALAGPGHCSRRDLALELAQGVHGLGKRFIAYLPCEVAANTSLHAGFQWNSAEGTDQAAFQRAYCGAVAEWARRFGDLLDGWWFDGCYTWPAFHSRGMDWNQWYQAARAGNPAAALTFNDGSFCVGNLQPVQPEHDYLSGEIEMLSSGRIRLGRASAAETHLPAGRFVPGSTCQWHGLLPVDCFWMHGAPPPTWVPSNPYATLPAGLECAPMEPPLYPDAELFSFTRACLQAGGALTFNVGLYEGGGMGKETVAQLGRLKAGL